jgi:hypothetical protein
MWGSDPVRGAGKQAHRVDAACGGCSGGIASSQKLGARSSSVSSKFYGQATKGAWWMPWQKQAMKDVASCDKPRGAASRH